VSVPVPRQRPSPRRSRRKLACANLAAAAALALAALVPAPGCVSFNYLEPAGPVLRFEARAPEAASPRSIRIVTFNVENGQHVDKAIEALTRHPDLREPDVLLLQEMTGTGVEAIARALSMAAAYYPASNHGGRDSGDAVLSQWPIESSWKVPLPHLSRTKREARAAVGARILVGERPLRAYAIHISSPFGLTTGERRDQIAAIVADAAASSDPVVIGGDCNGWRVGERFERAGYAWVTRDAGASLARFSVDHVFVRGLPAQLARSGVAGDVRGVSDHRPVWAEIEWPTVYGLRLTAAHGWP
jgi:endonuclease/exonuclease/phosphatase family metal-dependent hydrolase